MALRAHLALAAAILLGPGLLAPGPLGAGLCGTGPLGGGGAAAAAAPVGRSVAGPAGGFGSGPADRFGDPADRIFGGRDAESGPWAAALYWAGVEKIMCSGSVVAAQWVMTAAHCVPGMEKPGELPITMRIGHVEAARGEAIVVERIVLPPLDQHKRPRWDIVLLRLSRPITAPVPVRLAAQDPPHGADDEIFGWGRACAGDCGPSPVLRTATVRVAADTAFTDHYGGPAVGSTRGTGYARPGDSGGPQFHAGEQVGVASRAGTGVQMYASVARHLAWIRENVGP
ncbi:serine protease [Pilimelia anulata]|uniref:Serine protease n=1 Tax=Pilimelia anulata TaxID=53371 RepID=A0A8J3B5M0_9ACTN|nr:trypsin-like serine protease [Pilimelia anulata]GGJ89551.1 serine protease [Pilimelia anulata]